jgi:peptide/nickel transport system permease protein
VVTLSLPLVMGAVLVFAVIYVVANLLVDLAYLVIDPRIRRVR